MVNICSAIAVVLAISFSPLTGMQPGYFAEATVYSLDDTAQAEKSTVFRNINLQRIQNPIAVAPVQSFDVSAKGKLAVSLVTGAIHAYGPEGQFEYGYTF